MSAGNAATLETLRAMRELLAVPERWTKEESARNIHGAPVRILSDDACCFCLLGAGNRVTECSAQDDWYLALTGQLRIVGGLSDWNDAPERTHADVVNLLDRTIARLEVVDA